nr:MAG TPA: hypothetical protein [Caudoviricetes sp.]
MAKSTLPIRKKKTIPMLFSSPLSGNRHPLNSMKPYRIWRLQYARFWNFRYRWKTSSSLMGCLSSMPTTGP